MSAPVAIGLDIGGTKIAGAVVGIDGRVGRVERIATPGGGGRAVAEAAARLAAELVAAATGEGNEVRGVGVGTAGVVVAGRVVSANELIPSWAGTDLGGIVGESTGLAPTVLNDVHAAAIAESRRGAARTARAALVVSVGTGIGGAIVRRGELIAGDRGIAGSIGHVAAPRGDGRRCPCGALDHIEAYASGSAIEREYARLTGEALPLTAVAARAGDGDEVARGVIVEGGDLLGRTLGGAMNLIDPDVVVLGGGVPSIGPLFTDAVTEGVLRSRMQDAVATPVVRATFGTRATLVGAALSAWPSGGTR